MTDTVPMSAPTFIEAIPGTTQLATTDGVTRLLNMVISFDEDCPDVVALSFTNTTETQAFSYPVMLELSLLLRRPMNGQTTGPNGPTIKVRWLEPGRTGYITFTMASGTVVKQYITPFKPVLYGLIAAHAVFAAM